MEEDAIMLHMYAEIGRKWAVIAQSVKGRTDHSVKNRVLKLLKLFKIPASDNKDGSNTKLKQVVKELEERKNLKSLKDSKTPIVKNLCISEELMKKRELNTLDQNQVLIETKVEANSPLPLFLEEKMEESKMFSSIQENNMNVSADEDNKKIAELIKLNIYEMKLVNNFGKDGESNGTTISSSCTEHEEGNYSGDEVLDFVQPEDFYSN